MKNENVTKSKRGGKRDNAGRKLKNGEQTAVIRLPVSIVEKIKSGSFEFVTKSKQHKQVSTLEPDADLDKLVTENMLLKEDLSQLGYLKERVKALNKQVEEQQERIAEYEKSDSYFKVYNNALKKIEFLEGELKRLNL